MIICNSSTGYIPATEGQGYESAGGSLVSLRFRHDKGVVRMPLRNTATTYSTTHHCIM